MKIYLPLAVIAILFASCNSKTEKHLEIIKPVKYEKIDYSTDGQSHSFSGMVKSKHETNLSFKVGGTLNRVNVKLGDKVRKGQLIAAIDPIDYTVHKEQAIAQKKSAKSQLVMAQSTVSRVEKLYENNSIALSEYQKAKANLASAESQYKAADKQLDAAKNQIVYTRLYAPMNGVITSVNVEKNELTGAGKVIAVLNSEGKPEIEVGVPESIIGKLQLGETVNIKFSSLSKNTYFGKIEKIAFASGQSAIYPVIVSISKPQSEIRPGMSAEVRFNTEKNNEQSMKLVVPVSAVGKDTEGNFVFVLHKNNDSTYRTEKRKISIGKLLPKGFKVIDGLKENERVATAGLTVLRDGMTVRLLKSTK